MTKPEHITALVDTREHTPWDLSPLQMENASLATGDYSVRGLEHVVAIERKSLSDLLGCCGRQRERFDREVQRLLAYPVRALIVETTWSEIEAGQWRSQLKPQHITGALVGWIARGLPVCLAGDHERAGRLAARLLYTTARRRLRECSGLIEVVNENRKARMA